MRDACRRSQPSGRPPIRVTTWSLLISAGAAATDDSRYFWTHPISVGLQLSVPIFSGLTKMNRSRELKNQISQLSLQRSYARQQDRRAGALGAERPADRLRDDVRPGADRRAGLQGLQDLRTRYRAGAGTIRTQQRAALADAGAAELLAGDLRLPFRPRPSTTASSAANTEINKTG